MSGKLSSRYRKRNRRSDVGLSLGENNMQLHLSSSVQLPVHDSQSQSCILESQASFGANADEDKENKSHSANENDAAPLKSISKSKLSSRYSKQRRKARELEKARFKQLQSIQDPNAKPSMIKWASPVNSTDTRLGESLDQLTKRSGILKPQFISDSTNINNNAADTTSINSYKVCFSSLKDEKSGRVKRQKFTFTKGNTLQSTDPKYKGFAFTIGERVDQSVSCAHVWMKADKTYLGSMLTDLGFEWVLLKKHKMLPINGMIELKYLYNCVHLNEMDPEGVLCYEEDSATSFAFEFGLGESLNANDQTLKKPPKVLDLFAGGGGMSVGMRNAGFNVKYKVRLLEPPATICNWILSLFVPLYQVDSNESACETLKRNFPDSKVHTLKIEDFLDRWKRGRFRIDRSVIWLHGSPPCQAFSAINTSGGVNDATNASATLDFLEVAKYAQTPFVTMENVPGILHDTLVHGTNGTKNSYLKRVIIGLIELGYSVRICKVRASDFGDPTQRERIILFASKRGWKLPSSPVPTHGNVNGLVPVVTCRDALKELEKIDPVSDDEWATLADGREVWGHWEKSTFTDKFEEYESLKADETAITIRKKNPVKHYLLDRFVTILERARLMSFPDDYIFEGSPQECCDQIGNAVPVRLAEAIGRAVMESYRLGRHSSPSK
jgi:DNA (cytosine-5)-methyltransferase 1